MAKVLVIGIDGSTFDIIKPLIKENKVPTFKKFIEQGSHGILRTVLPSVSTTSWTSLCTGKTPAKHGVFDFYKMAKDNYDIELNSSKAIKSKRIWELIGRKSIVINIPLSYPDNSKEDIIITGLFTPKDKPYTNREDVIKKIEENIGEYLIDVCHLTIRSNEELYKKIHQVTENRFKVSKFLMNNYDWDFFFVVFTSTDRLQHSFWGDKKKIEEYYVKLDNYINELTKDLDDTHYIFLVSDHGFCKRKGQVYLNSWLNKLGFLERKDKGNTSKALANWDDIKDVKRNIMAKNLLRFINLDKEKMRSLFRYLKLTRFQRYIPKKIKNLFPDYSLAIDWEKTKAYTRLNNNLSINLEGRDPKGIVKKEDYEKVCNEIIEHLKNLKDNDDENVFGEIYKKEEIYRGPYLEDIPDILFSLKGYKNNTNFSKKIILKESGMDGVHNEEGIFFLKGKDIKQGQNLGILSLLDVAPTILHLLDTKIPIDIDGKVIKKAFKDYSDLAKKEIIFEDKTQQEKQRIKDILKRIS